jgi:hypothetical protein
MGQAGGKYVRCKRVEQRSNGRKVDQTVRGLEH